MSLTSSEEVSQSHITFEETPERLKVTIPVRRKLSNWVFLALYTVMLAVWVGGFFYGISAYTRNVRASSAGGSFIFVLTLLVILMLLVWLWFGRRFIWRWWQYHMANREILFINKDMLIVRRPVSILGLTDAYDMKHLSPLYWSDKYNCLAFDYGARGVLFGTTLPQRDAQWLLLRLNDRYFPGWRDEDDEDDEARQTLFD
jgi:hypothetical protein